MENQNRIPSVVMPKCSNIDLLKGQKALVTGANSGIGKGIVIELARAGADVVINYIVNKEAAEELADYVETEFGINAYPQYADVSKENDVKIMFEKMLNKFGTIDILINNAGLQRDAPFEEMSLKEWNKVIDVNLTGQFLCAREAVKEFKKRGVVEKVSCSAGKILHISSVHEVIPWAGRVNYAASKGGVMMLMQSIAQEVAPFRIRVNSISPGAIKTSINKAAWSSPQAHDSLMDLIPYKRIGEVEDVGRLATWLASDYADYITGTSIYIDGGMTLYPGFATGGG